MKAEAVGEWYLYNGHLISTEEREIFSLITKPPVYEVIRVIDGVPLFLDDHLNRLAESARMINHQVPYTQQEICTFIKEVIRRNEIKNNNLKLLSVDEEDSGYIFLVYSVASYYPPAEFFDTGVKVILYEYERNQPNVKLLVSSFKEDIAQMVRERGAFEALLVNSSGCAAEGSRSNLFFVRDNQVFTSPEVFVLPGITRKHLIEIARREGIDVVEQCVHVDEIGLFEGAFLAGTSINVLPISQIQKHKLASSRNNVIDRLSKAYLRLIAEYVAEHRVKCCSGT